MATKVVENWSTSCSCGYGRGGWASSPALQDPPMPIITRETTHCPGCGEEFTEQYGVYYEDEET